jgi:hypothetical protein
MGFAENYFRKQQSFKPSIQVEPHRDLAFIIVIPATRETGLISSLESLFHCLPIRQKFEIIVFINAATNAPEETRLINKRSFEDVLQFSNKNINSPNRIFPILREDLPNKYAGVGLARKSGMDEALWRFNIINKPEGFIICFDADATCDNDYFIAIENHITNFPSTRGCSIYFEHDADNEIYPEYQRKAIISYEIHLRYYKLALQNIGFPYSYHTVGSSMLVNALCYAQQGGMNKQKAGEDFYFLQKIIPLGEFYELNETRILLSSRKSDRVPFGTGGAISKMMIDGNFIFKTYSFQSILGLKKLFSETENFFRVVPAKYRDMVSLLPDPLKEYLIKNGFERLVNEMNQNSSGIDTFRKRFFQWWNAFRIMKYLNYVHSTIYTKIDATIAAEELLECLIPGYCSSGNPKLVLESLRKLERYGKI